MKKMGLGRGLDALLPVEQDNEKEIIEVKINDIEPNEKQPRKNFDDEKLMKLAESIKAQGIIQPIIVKRENDIYRIVAGERRWRAAKIAGITHIPVIVREMTERQIMEIALIENLQREDLNPIEEAEAFEKLIKEYGLTQEEIAKTVGRSRPAIANALRLLSLDESIKEYIVEGQLSSGHARALIPLEDKELQKEVAEKIIEGGMSVRETENLVKKILNEKDKIKDEKKKIEKNEEIMVIEEKLKNIFGTKVKILHKKNKGKIIIDYYSNDDLDRLIEIMGKNAR